MIYSYSRADAIRDGVLIELPDAIVREAGIVFPVAVTDNLWGTYIEPDYLDKLPGQSVNGRLWDLFWMFHLAARWFAEERSDGVRAAPKASDRVRMRPPLRLGRGGPAKARGS